MNKILYCICAVALALGLASCDKEDVITPENPEETGMMTITASLEDATTRTALLGNDAIGYKMVWREYDEIYVFEGTRAYVFRLTKGAGTTIAEFTGSSLPDGEYPVYCGETITPKETIIPKRSYLSLNVNNQEGQEMSPGYYALNIPMKSTLRVENGTAHNIHPFRNMCGLLRLDVTGYGKPDRIIVSTDKKVTGPFQEDAEGNIVIDNGNSDAKDYVYLHTNRQPLSSEPHSFYIPLPQGDYSNVKIIIEDRNTDGLCQRVLKAGKTLSIRRSEIYPISMTANLISGTTSRTARNGDKVPVKWVQLWEKGPRWAVENVKPQMLSTSNLYAFSDIPSWGDNWRLPTHDEVADGLWNCKKEWVTIDGKQGLKFTGKGIFSENSIFLPADGYERGTSESHPDWVSIWCPGGEDNPYGCSHYQNSSTGIHGGLTHGNISKCSVRYVLNKNSSY